MHNSDGRTRARRTITNVVCHDRVPRCPELPMFTDRRCVHQTVCHTGNRIFHQNKVACFTSTQANGSVCVKREVSKVVDGWISLAATAGKRKRKADRTTYVLHVFLCVLVVFFVFLLCSLFIVCVHPWLFCVSFCVSPHVLRVLCVLLCVLLCVYCFLPCFFVFPFALFVFSLLGFSPCVCSQLCVLPCFLCDLPCIRVVLCFLPCVLGYLPCFQFVFLCFLCVLPCVFLCGFRGPHVFLCCLPCVLRCLPCGVCFSPVCSLFSLCSAFSAPLFCVCVILVFSLFSPCVTVVVSLFFSFSLSYSLFSPLCSPCVLFVPCVSPQCSRMICKIAHFIQR